MLVDALDPATDRQELVEGSRAATSLHDRPARSSRRAIPGYRPAVPSPRSRTPAGLAPAEDLAEQGAHHAAGGAQGQTVAIAVNHDNPVEDGPIARSFVSLSITTRLQPRLRLRPDIQAL